MIFLERAMKHTADIRCYRRVERNGKLDWRLELGMRVFGFLILHGRRTALKLSSFLLQYLCIQFIANQCICSLRCLN
jgi:hypothetical protein